MINQFNNIEPSGFVLKTKYDADKTDLEKKIPNTNRLVKKSDYNAKISELEIKIPSISGLVTNSALTEVENKTSNVSSLIKKTNYNKKVSQLEQKLTDHKHGKYITTPAFNKLTAENFAARLVQENLVIKADFDDELSSLHRKITSNKTKHLLVENHLKKLGMFDSFD